MFNVMLLIVYLLGGVVTIVVPYRNLEKGEDVTFNGIIFSLILSAFSWIGFILFCVMVYGDTIIFTKK